MVKRRNFIRSIALGGIGFQIFHRSDIFSVAKEITLISPNLNDSNILMQPGNGYVMSNLQIFRLRYLGQLSCRNSAQISDSQWGVSCSWIADEHPLSVEQRINQLNTLGAKWALLMPDWNCIERERGKYDWNTVAHRLDDVINGLARLKINPIIQIYGGNQLYMKTESDSNNRPLADAEKLLYDIKVRQAWHDFLKNLVRRYKTNVRVWEIWNEPNYEAFWATPTTVKDYGRIVKEVASVIRHEQPDAVVLAGATANIPLDYLNDFLSGDGSNSFDHWSIHPYGEFPESKDSDIHHMQKTLLDQGKSSVIWQTECGFPSGPETGGWGWGGPWNEKKHAKWLLRRLISDAAIGMQTSIYFVLNDYHCLLEGGPDKGKMGINLKGLHYFGTWKPKPAAFAFSNLASVIDDRLERMPNDINLEIISSDVESLSHVRTYTLKEKAKNTLMVVYWLSVPIETDFAIGKIQLILPPDMHIDDPVLVDLLDGCVYAVNQLRNGDRIMFEDLPIGDSPLVLCSRRLPGVIPAKGSGQCK